MAIVSTPKGLWVEFFVREFRGGKKPGGYGCREHGHSG